ncbi:MarR family winged helix-turn-helix transcriptional regulator [Camelliibacillus cellulosilyticus]|uniref:MarR family winged helix-turn-helix transcriptional regulator n=1 Tax=Camelliibacillus cellulosilyticus TaxID=2174486 RepID=A0ABV9GIU5_9BACL
MDEKKLTHWVDRYEELSFLIQKKGEYMVNKKIFTDDEMSEPLTYDQHFALRCIKKYEPCTSTDLARLFHVQKSAITALINRLVDKALILRERSQEDRRIVYLRLTDKGMALFEDCQAMIHDIVSVFINRLDEKEIETFIATYEKISVAMDEAIKEGGQKSP